MADTKITGLTALSEPAVDDLLEVVDISDTTFAAEGTNKKSTTQQIIQSTVHSATEKTTPVDADEVGLIDSAASYVLKRLSFLNLKKAVGSYLNPVGTIREFNVSTNPATLLGFGTWSAYGAGRVTVCLDSSDTDFDTVDETGGAKTHTLTSSESGVPAHAHPENANVRMNVSASSNVYIASSGSSNWSNIESGGRAEQNTKNNTAADASSAHNNQQKYIVVYRWCRVS